MNTIVTVNTATTTPWNWKTLPTISNICIPGGWVGGWGGAHWCCRPERRNWRCRSAETGQAEGSCPPGPMQQQPFVAAKAAVAGAETVAAANGGSAAHPTPAPGPQRHATPPHPNPPHLSHPGPLWATHLSYGIVLPPNKNARLYQATNEEEGAQQGDPGNNCHSLAQGAAAAADAAPVRRRRGGASALAAAEAAACAAPAGPTVGRACKKSQSWGPTST